MSEENVELLRRFYGQVNALGRTGSEFIDPEELAPELWARVAPEFEFRERADLPDAKVYRGREESKQWWRKTQQLFAETHSEPREFIDLGDAVAVETRIWGIGRGSGVRVEAEETHVYWFRDGMIVCLQGFPTKAEALEAAGLPE